ncbi:hypothetical protein N7527_001332 [Penicillium freii]|nr:hypothetical protein N7527_001332 [Penicillium freii]
MFRVNPLNANHTTRPPGQVNPLNANHTTRPPGQLIYRALDFAYMRETAVVQRNRHNFCLFFDERTPSYRSNNQKVTPNAVI